MPSWYTRGMQIIGHGIDLADIGRMGRLLARFGDAALERQFTERERDDAPAHGRARASYFAGRFAAKEAVLKALGTGFARGVAFTDVQVLCSPGGAPRVTLGGQAAAVADQMGIRAWILSLSHSGDVAVASAIAVDADPAAKPHFG